MARPKPNRKERIPMDGTRMRLEAPQCPPGFVQRWVNDEEGGRISRFQDAGYEFVEDPSAPKSSDPQQSSEETTDIGSRISRIVGSNKDGSPKRAYLMRQRRNWYEQDQRKKLEVCDEIDEQVKRGNVENEISPKHRRSTPGDIQVTHGSKQ